MTDRRPAEDLWHLSIDDLFAAPVETPRLGGPGPFVINLSASTAPISVPPKNILSFEGLHAYQVTRTEDGRQRFRLRLGLFSSELEADAILAVVREHYPSAMTATAADDDLRAITVAKLAAEKAKPAKPAPPAPVPVVTARKQRPAPQAAQEPQAQEEEGWDLDALLPHLGGAAPGSAKNAPARRPAATQPSAKPAPAPPPRAVAAVVKKALGTPPTALAPDNVPHKPAQPTSQPPAKAVSAPTLTPASPVPPRSPASSSEPRQPAAAATPPVLVERRSQPRAAAMTSPPAQVPRRPMATASARPPLLDQPMAPRAAATPPSARPVAPPTAVTLVDGSAIADGPVTVEAKPSAPVETTITLELVDVQPPAAQPSHAGEDFFIELELAPEEQPEPPPSVTSALLNEAPTPMADLAIVDDRCEPQDLVAKINAIVESLETDADPIRLSAASASEVQPATVSAVPAVAIAPPAAIPAPQPTIEELIAREIESAVEPVVRDARVAATAAPVEMDWGAILSHPIDSGAAQSAFPMALDTPAPPAPSAPPATTSEPGIDPDAETDQVPVLTLPAKQATEQAIVPAAPKPMDDLVVVDDGVSLESMVVKSNAMVESLAPRVDKGERLAVAVEPASVTLPPTATKPPSSASAAAPATIEEGLARKLEMLAELLPDLTKTNLPRIDSERATRATDAVPKGPAREPDVDPAASDWDDILDVTIDEAAPVLPLQDVVAERLVGNIDRPAAVIETHADTPPPSNPPAIEAEAVPAASSVAAVHAPAPAVAVADDEGGLERLVAKSNALVESIDARAFAPSASALREPTAELPSAPVIADAPAKAEPPSAPVIIDAPAKAEVPPALPVVAPNLAKALPKTPSTVVAAAPTSVETAPSTKVDTPVAPPAAPAIATNPPARSVVAIAPAVEAAVKVVAPPTTATEPPPAEAPPRIVSAPVKMPVHTRSASNVHNKSHRGRKSSHPKSDAKTAGTSKNLATPAVNAAQSANGGAAPKAHAASTKTQDQQQTKPVAPSAPKVASPRAQAPVATPVNGRKVEILTEPLPAVDSTQTIRALTPLELGDEQASRWFAIQLSLADQPFDPNHVPHLDIFDQFRLYSVAGMDQGKYMHSLRLGFFESEASAQAVAGYLKCFFDTPAVKRVSNAERERFAEQQKVVARKDIGATGLHAVIELSSPRPVPETTLADLAESSGQRVTDDKSLWSRLIAPLKR